MLCGMKSRFLLFTALLALSACSGNEVRNTLGLERNAPDEFVVLSRPPLSVPPEFELRPPGKGVPPAGTSTRDAARKAVLGTSEKPASLDEVDAPSNVDTAVTPVLSSDAASSAESRLLSRSGAENADPDIREKLGKSKPKAKSTAKSLLEKIAGEEGAEPLVDARKETVRVRKNAQSGKKINEGKVPTLDPGKTSVIDKIF